MHRLVTAVIILDSTLSQDFAYVLKSVPKLYAVIVKLCQLMIEKKSFEKIPLVCVSRILSGFFGWSILKKIEVLHRENEEEKFSFWKKDYLIASLCTYSDSSRQAELKYIYPDHNKIISHCYLLLYAHTEKLRKFFIFLLHFR